MNKSAKYLLALAGCAALAAAILLVGARPTEGVPVVAKAAPVTPAVDLKPCVGVCADIQAALFAASSQAIASGASYVRITMPDGILLLKLSPAPGGALPLGGTLPLSTRF